MFFGWEGVGLASYLLIGFWYKKPSANAAAMKAFVVNRVGDFGFALGIFGVFVLFGSIELSTRSSPMPRPIFAPAEGGRSRHAAVHELPRLRSSTSDAALTVVCLLLFMGAMGKSAQFLLHTWLPDAMEGPTPVSALIHAATMVTAGVFMVARMSPIFELSHTALTVVTIIGATTAFFAATVGLVQNDIKRVIAYSTCSQLGYMFVALGVGAYGAAIFHLFTHAFFKALLFLGAGSVIHAVSDEQDMRNMGGLRKHIPTHLLDDDDRHHGADRPRHSRHDHRHRRLLLQGRHHRKRLRRRERGGRLCLRAAGDRRLLHQLLLVAADLHDLPRQAARFARCHAPCA